MDRLERHVGYAGVPGGADELKYPTNPTTTVTETPWVVLRKGVKRLEGHAWLAGWLVGWLVGWLTEGLAPTYVFVFAVDPSFSLLELCFVLFCFSFFFLFLFFSVCLSVCLPVSLSLSLSLSVLSLSLSVYLSLSILSICLSLPVCLCLYLSVCLSLPVCLSVWMHLFPSVVRTDQIGSQLCACMYTRWETPEGAKIMQQVARAHRLRVRTLECPSLELACPHFYHITGQPCPPLPAGLAK